MAKNNRIPAEYCKLGHAMARDNEGQWRCPECRRAFDRAYYYVKKIRAYERETA